MRSWPGVATGLTLAALLLVVKALFFFGDNGFPDYNRADPETGQPVPPYCDPGANCVYSRYLAAGRGPDFESIGVTDTASFSSFYWNQQFSTAGVPRAADDRRRPRRRGALRRVPAQASGRWRRGGAVGQPGT